MATPTSTAPVDHDADLSIVRNDLPFRLQRRLGLIPAEGLGLARRAIGFGLIAWLPIAIWAWYVDRFLPGRSAEPFVHQFSIHARCLLAIPLFILAEGTARDVGRMIITRLLDQGFIVDDDRPRLRDVLISFTRIRDGVLPWVMIAGIILTVLLVAPTIEHNQDVLFAPGADGAPGHLTFGGFWYLYVSRSIFMALLLAWAWRLILWTYVLFRVARLDLALVPTHPDRMFGVGVLARTPAAFWPLVLAVSLVMASVWAHDVLYQGVALKTLYVPGGVFIAIVAAVLLLPLLVFVPKFIHTKRRALAEYGGILAAHGRLVHSKWIAGIDVGDPPLLDAPEIGPVADTVALYEAVAAQYSAPINKTTLISILLPIVVPMLGVAALQIPIGELLLSLLKAVV